jgi:HK97 family phage prohead protease
MSINHMSFEQKVFTLTEMSEQEGLGIIKGYCSTKNVLDSVGDVIVDGAYADLDVTLKEGFICNSHAHDEPLGYFTKITEDANGLYFEAQFHGTDDAEECYKMCRERYEAGKKVTFSIGYRVLDAEYGEFEGKACRFLKKIFVKEASITLVPANENTVLTEVKTRSTQFDSIKGSIDDYTARLKEIHALGRGEKWLVERKTEADALTSAVENIHQALLDFGFVDPQEDQLAEEHTEADLGAAEEKSLELALAKAKAVLAR